ncbi:MAG: molybdopterin converting factor subunit 1 [Myxococcota bacterium]|nr:molybdopterin converting factor subunit 1 [Myxococcota bacterium]
MVVNVLYFASLRERAGCANQTLQLPRGATVADAFALGLPRDVASAGGVLFAVNQAYVQADHVLFDGDEVAFIPPLGGG